MSCQRLQQVMKLRFAQFVYHVRFVYYLWMILYKVAYLALSLTDFGVPCAWHPQGQCHLNKKNLAKAGAFESEAGVPELLALERMESPFDHARIKAQTTSRQQGARLTQIHEQALLESGKLLACDHCELITGGLQNLQGISETELVGIQLGL